LAHPNFRHISVITAWNMHRDKIKQLGAQQFASDTGHLVDFYSIDKWKLPSAHNNGKKQKKSKKMHASEVIDSATQKILWNLPHNSCQHVPGKLSICKGMPVLIKNNEATECCITNGAEAKIVSWHSHHEDGVAILDTLFVELVNPPHEVQLEGLPLNVVPLTKHSIDVTCKMPDDTETIIRQQVLILPNFAMTDYASQGRTRPNNVVYLNNCSNHQSYYTCLSRSASAEGTIIVQGFDPSKMMEGAFGYLRQEFRELEILDNITELQYNGMLPGHIEGHRTNTLVRPYQLWKKNECPKNVHPATAS
ncbi:hypothetical protein GLOTRDRAFT_41544, partial [Gloeophyllum trabeum ATCC 11539]